MTLSPAVEPMVMAEQFDIGHGRVESSHLISCSILKDYCDWPGCEQVFEIERNVIFKNTAACRQELLVLATSAIPEV